MSTVSLYFIFYSPTDSWPWLQISYAEVTSEVEELGTAGKDSGTGGRHQKGWYWRVICIFLGIIWVMVERDISLLLPSKNCGVFWNTEQSTCACWLSKFNTNPNYLMGNTKGMTFLMDRDKAIYSYYVILNEILVWIFLSQTIGQPENTITNPVLDNMEYGSSALPCVHPP